MRMMSLKYYSLLGSMVLSFLYGCEFQPREDEKLSEFYWLEGTWKILDSEENAFESWEIDDQLMTGTGYKLDENNDTIINERMSLQLVDSTIEFVADVSHNDKPIHFRLVESASEFRFENKEHDFPKWLIYNKISRDSMSATIGDEQRHITFQFVRTSE